MPRVDETEVIESTHTANTAGQVESSVSKSLQYVDTDVTQNERDVRFWNTNTWSDTSTSRERKIMCVAHAVGHGIDVFGDQVTHEYQSPLPPMPLQPDVDVNVPDLSLPEYEFDVSTDWELFEKVNGEYSKINYGTAGPITATVHDNSSG